MIPVAAVNEPPEFAEVRQRGLEWLADHPNHWGRPAPYWRPFRKLLREGFQHRCGYTAMYEPMGTVDHFTSVNSEPAGAYEWSNYRFCSAWINSAKKPAGDGKWMDPYLVPRGCFQVQLPDMQLLPGPNVPSDLVVQVDYTLRHLPIRDDERIIDLRREWYELFKGAEIEFVLLSRMAPLVADAVQRFNLNHGYPEDSRKNLP